MLTDTFEPGSTLKPFTVGLALELGRITPQTVIQTAPGSLTIGNYTIHDAHAGGAMSVAQVVQKSSNVGAAKIALSLPRAEMHGMFRRVGFGAAPRLGFPRGSGVERGEDLEPIGAATGLRARHFVS